MSTPAAGHEVAELGERWLERLLTPELRVTHDGKVVVVNVDTGAVAFGRSAVECHRGLPAGGRCYAARVGDIALHRFGYFGKAVRE